jgi:hypothetical protein
MGERKSAAPKIDRVILSILLTIRKGHGTSHRHEGNGFLTLNAFIENVMFCVVRMEKRISRGQREDFFSSASLATLLADVRIGALVPGA